MRFCRILDQILLLLVEWRIEKRKQHKEIMIAQASLDASLASLTTASTATSTPDTVVAAYQAGVDAQTVALAASTPPPATPAAK